ncbi:hypothetical protein PISL3812_06230 [Talaromyces islandicus]|uniref:Major facilitator superfamily (MFS) profile domain-containing protein n=1 Tax=Talaromyces islandicus TaxID=28573 RepID=A0A0U1M0X2_TALIS|nr:hypothetical protein PISL3812_06230 [Talaromyces islandicus]
MRDEIELVSKPQHDGLETSAQSSTKRNDALISEGQSQRSKASMIVITLALAMATFLAALDVAVVTTALPYIAGHFSASQTAYSWIGSAYLLPYAAMGPFWAKCSDIFGRKVILLAVNGIFLVGSLVCALSNSVAMLIAGRAIQGAAGGGLVVLVNITLSDLKLIEFPPHRERGKYFGFIGMVWATASAIGPVIGGALAEKVSWRWCFYINLPCDGAAFLVLLLFLRVHNPHTKLSDGLRAIDWGGSLFILGATLMLLFGLQFGGFTSPWGSAMVICLIVFGVLSFAIFFLLEWRIAKYPIIPLRIFRKGGTLAALGVASTHGFAFVAAPYFLPLYFQTALGASPIESGTWFLPLALVLAALSILTGNIIKWTGRYLELIIGGMALATLGFGLFINLLAERDWPRIIIFQMIAAIGLGPNFQAPLVAMQTQASSADMATATATFGFVRNLSSAISVVIGGLIIQNRMLSYTDQFEAAGIPASMIGTLSSAGSSDNTSIADSLTDAQLRLVRQKLTASLSKMWIFYTVLLFIGLLASLKIGQHELSKKHEEHKTGLAAEEKSRHSYTTNNQNEGLENM